MHFSGTAVAKVSSGFAEPLCLYPIQPLGGTDCLIVLFLPEVTSPKIDFEMRKVIWQLYPQTQGADISF